MSEDCESFDGENLMFHGKLWNMERLREIESAPSREAEIERMTKAEIKRLKNELAELARYINGLRLILDLGPEAAPEKIFATAAFVIGRLRGENEALKNRWEKISTTVVD